MLVRDALFDDCEAIAAIHVRGWQVAYRGLLPDELLDGLSIEPRRRMCERIAQGRYGASCMLVAEDDEAIVGFAIVLTPAHDADLGSRTAELAAIYVEPERWRRGAGTALLELRDGLGGPIRIDHCPVRVRMRREECADALPNPRIALR